MVIVLSDEEKLAVKNGEKTIQDIINERGEEVYNAPGKEEKNLSELEKVKQEIRETNILYKESIQKNKELYEELKNNRKEKERLRKKISELRIRKKKLLGTI